jgi:polyhydroxyalkanoate synthesis repressor PhaR
VKPATVVIKKYGNRRLYDTYGSRYVNLDDIAALIRQGKDIQVLDARSGDDLTRLTLTQIISEDVKEKPSGLPLELLRQLIVASDRASQEFISWYLNSAMDAYKKVRHAMQDRITDVQSAVFSPLDTVRRLISGEPGTRPAESQSELETLRQRVAELEALLSRSVPPRRKRAATTKKTKRPSASRTARG